MTAALWLSTMTEAICAAFRRAVTREDKLHCLDALEEVTRLTGVLA